MKNNDEPYCRNEISKLAKSTGIIAIGEIIGNGVIYLTSVIITRKIGAQLYGLYFLSNVVTYIGTMISRLGLDYSVLRFVSLFKGKHENQRIDNTIRTSVFISTLLSTCCHKLV